MWVVVVASFSKMWLLPKMQNITSFIFLVESMICIIVVFLRGVFLISSNICFCVLNIFGSVSRKSSWVCAMTVSMSVMTAGCSLRNLSIVDVLRFSVFICVFTISLSGSVYIFNIL